MCERRCTQELLGAPGVAKLVADTAAAKEVAALAEFFATLAAEPARAFYGPGHVLAAAEQGAVGKLLLSDSLYRWDARPGSSRSLSACMSTAPAAFFLDARPPLDVSHSGRVHIAAGLRARSRAGAA